ncbi:FG-GAP repeat domain-containing protein [Umezawaea sp. NPDC059074]|uniref:FG-GAP repeat domain-containing protein n=1 Tax=Umezawaea sp. NPDC059074 TaxID=3346716 RepID=UPI0036836E29
MKNVIRRLVRAVAASAVAVLVLAGTASTAGATNATTDLMWFNRGTGEVSSWQLNGYGNVLGAQPLTWTCSYASGCSTAWKPIGTGDLNNDGDQDVTWFNRTSGEVSTWLTNGSGTVLGTQPVDWHCDQASGCSTQWKPIALGDVNGDHNQDVVWWNSGTGVVSAWLLNGYGNVLAKQDLDWRCDYSSTCATYWRPVGVGDVNGDGHVDLVWFNYFTGVVSSWLLNGYGNVLAKQDVDWHCDYPSGCSSRWRPIGVGDLNGDGRQDVTWYDDTSGVVSSWLLNGYGNVLAKQDVDWHCDYTSGCSSTWGIVDLVR